MDFGEFDTIGFLYISNTIWLFDESKGKFVIAGIEELDCRVFGNHEAIQETTIQEWPPDDWSYP